MKADVDWSIAEPPIWRRLGPEIAEYIRRVAVASTPSGWTAANGRKLREARRQLSLSQEDLAKRLGFKSAISVFHWERGAYAPLAKYRKPLSEILGITL